MSKSKKISFGKISSNFSEKTQVIEATGGFGKFGPTTAKPVQIENLGEDTESEQMKEVMGISGFGKKAKSFDVQEMMEQIGKARKLAQSKPAEKSASESEDSEDSDDSDLIGPPIPADLLQKKEEPLKVKGGDDLGSDNEVDEDAGTFIPCAEEISMNHGLKAVTALSADPSGARLASGSVDYDLSFWDFAGMDTSMRSFRTLQPCDNHPIRYLQYSGTGDLLLVISGAAQAKILDRDGFEQLETVKGDMYISDQAQTKGHTASLLSGAWNPGNKEEFLTTSADGTARVWMVHNAKHHKALVKFRAHNGLKVSPTACAYNRNGSVFACGCSDGSLQLWDMRKSSVAPCIITRNAHQATEISSINYSYMGNWLVTRSCDDSMKLWDIKNMKTPLFSVNDLFARYDTTDAIFSPNDKVIVTGTSMKKEEASGNLLFYDTNTMELIRKIETINSHVIKIIWHAKLNQLFASTGNGIIKCYYDQERSLRGVTLCTKKIHRPVKHAEVVSLQQVITPHALPLFRQERRKTSRKQMEKDRLDPVKSHRPDLPITSGQGGRLASSGGTLSSFVIRNLGLSKRVDDDQDPREAILKYAKEAAENPYWIAPAYSKTQPKVILEGMEEGETSKKKAKTK